MFKNMKIVEMNEVNVFQVEMRVHEKQRKNTSKGNLLVLQKLHGKQYYWLEC